MKRRSLLIICVCTTLFSLLALPCHAAASHAIALPMESDLISQGQLYMASTPTTPTYQNLAEFKQQLTPVDQVDLKGGSYWFHAQIDAQSNTEHWVLYSRGTYIENLQLFVFNQDDEHWAQSGQNNPGTQLLHYGMPFTLNAEKTYDFWLLIDSQYYSGAPRFNIAKAPDYESILFSDSLLIMGCLGAIFILSFYNLLIFFWTKDRSYFYYFAYLVTTFTGWCAVFGIFNKLFGVIDISLMMLPFFLNIITNVFFYQSFLSLKSQHPFLHKFSAGIMLMSFFCMLVAGFFPYWVRYLSIVILHLLWLSTGLMAGIICLRNGFKPARFFIIGFALVSVGGFAVILPYFGFPRYFQNEYMAALIAQTLDVMFLALALADRINLLRKEKQEALEKALAADQLSNRTLKEANDKLLTALSMSEENQKAKDAFILSVSHELRTPLNSIGVSLDQLKQATPDETRELHHYIQYGVDRLSSHIENILLLAETEQNDAHPRARGFCVKSLLERLKISHQSYLYEKPVDIKIEIPEHIPDTFIGDDHLIYSMLSPIVDNACKYIEKGQITLAVEFTPAIDEEEPNYLLFYIRDTGPGISESLRTKVFDPFVQASSGYQRSHEGLGLGLSITQRLAKTLNAAIEMESEVGIGSCFNFCIPIDYKMGKTPPEPKKIATHQHVLVVEDNRVNAKVLCSHLMKKGIKVDVVTNGLEASQLPYLHNYSAIFMDLQMPVMDGFTATLKIRELGITCPIIAVTANSDFHARSRCWDVGMNDFLGKPIRRELLDQVLERWIL